MKKIILILSFLHLFNVKAQVIPVTEAQLFKAFKQDIVHFQGTLSKLGGGGNCASIALIKAAIGTFGINGVFKSVTYDSTLSKATVVKRDNTITELSFERLDNGRDFFFITPDSTSLISLQICDYARLCFAVICREKQLDLGYDKTYFYRGVDDLNKGEAAESIYEYLGLRKEQISDLSIENLKKYKNLVLYIAPHAVYSSSGNYDEFFQGTKTGIEPLKRIGVFHCKGEGTCKILGAYTLK